MADAQTLLILPGGYGDGPEVRRHALMLGLTVIGASSAPADPAAPEYPTWLALPHVSDLGFADAVAAAITGHGVRHIHASHYAVWFALKDLLPTLAPHVGLSRGRSNHDLTDRYEALRERVAAPPELPGLERASEPRPGPNPTLVAGFLRAAMDIPGESYEPKLLALIEVARRAPQGDIVEVGCLFGRTAALLAMLADHFDLGRVLCVDPWSLVSTEQGNAQLQASSLGFDWDSFRRIFEVNVAPFARGRLNYIHAPSIEGFARYATGAPATTEAFGETHYEGRIGLLHIDGNHDYAYAAEDVRSWTPCVRDGGWIVIDDYDWDWGDGPRRVGDAFLASNAARIRAHFVVGGALFIQLV